MTQLHVFFHVMILILVSQCLSSITCQEQQYDLGNNLEYHNLMESVYKFEDVVRESKKFTEEMRRLSISKRVDTHETGKHTNFFRQKLEYMPVPYKDYNVSDKCLYDTMILFESLGYEMPWALSMIDAVGKLPSGLLLGNTKWPGNYGQCTKVTASVYKVVNKTIVVEHPYQGKYCIATIGNSTTFANADPLTLGTPGGPQSLSLGVCVPDSCSIEDTRDLVNTALFEFPKEYEALAVTCPPKSIPLDTPAIGVLVLMSLLAAVIIAGTLYDIYLRKPFSGPSYKEGTIIHGLVSEPEYDNDQVTEDTVRIVQADLGKVQNFRSITAKILLSFSILTNGEKILSTEKREGSLNCVHGIRFLSMSWVIWGHTYAFSITFIENMLDLYSVIQSWPMQILKSGTLSVDSFFLLSGLLVSYLTLREMAKKGGIRGINWLLFYFHRFWRLTPPYMLVLGIHTALFKYIATGPFVPEKGLEPFCPKYWWTNFLYVNNLVEPLKACMGWAWYLANDMQFFILSPLFLIPLFKNGIIGSIIVSGVMMISFISTAVISYSHKFSAGMLGSIFPHENTTGNFFNDMYITPWTRIGPYLVGILTGYILYKTDRKLKLHWSVALCGWMVAAAVSLSTVYGTLGVFRGHYSDSVLTDAMYNTFWRTGWSLGLAWVIVACVCGYGGFVNTILSWSGLVPLSRLTYSAYLVHPIVMYWYYVTREKLIFFQNTTMTYLFFGHLVISYGIAFVTSLCLEAPMMGLEKVIFKRGN